MDGRTRDDVDEAGVDGAGVAGGTGRWDRFAHELQALRRAAGEPSFAEIARRVAELRVADGADEHAARVARTTVYDAFRTGRARVNVPLVREIVAALDADPALVDGWLAAPAPSAPSDSSSDSESPTAEPPVAPSVPAAPSEPSEPSEPSGPAVEGRRPRRRTVLLLLTALIAVNVLGRAFVDLFGLPIYLDMIGTASAAIALGPWYGVAVAVVSNLAGMASSGADSAPFMLVNAAGALVWGYGVRRWGMGRTLPRFFTLNLLVAAVCSLVAVPLLLVAFGGSVGHGQDLIASRILDTTTSSVLAVALANLLVSLADKVIAGFAALVVVSGLPAGLRAGAPIPVVVASEPRPGPGR
ncbi:ECF transporter S component [Nocardioides marmotae]|uniref:ECF transporter S component n=1 Tax=Nocardioides marmotae TaxID=2663857 RepID=UPI0012B54123|nr:ECF transporter S component [Nocardioides marmotae]MBC9732458.1 hypothetical protein [Nocardioides marmotae]MTB83577.1 hypothetical protein [Nocardioides marmotae]